MISYAQNREDVLLDRIFPRGVPGFYIDVGASHPTEFSVTRHFYDLGWRGINIEPSKPSFTALATERTRDVNLNVGVGDEPGQLEFFEFAEPLSGISTFSEEQAEWHRGTGLEYDRRAVEVRTLASICEEHVDGEISFISVDVEGHEAAVLSGADWTRWRPTVVLVEATRPRTRVPSYDSWEPILLDAGYVFAAFDGLNRYYVRSEDARLAEALAVPVNVMDEYVPYELSKQIEHWRWAFEAVERQLTAARAANASLAAEKAMFGPELSVLRADFERLDRQLTNTRSQHESTRGALVQARLDYDRLIPTLEAVRDRNEAAHALFDNIGPGGLGVARRITAVSSRHPGVGTRIKGAARAGLFIRRALRNRQR